MTTIIVGGGLAGLTAAYELSIKKRDIVLLEKDEALGGLASSFKVDEQTWLEKYYHHIFTSDNHILALLDELGLKGTIIWKATKMGFYHDKKLYGFGTPFELLKFPPLGIRDKIRFGKIILSLRLTTSWEKLDKISARGWLIQQGGLKLYERIWEPLLKVKFGSKLEKASAAWLWGRIKPRAGSRSKAMASEVLGYLEGGFQVLIDTLADRIRENGGSILTGKGVSEVIIENNRVKGVVCSNEIIKADSVVLTIPLPEALSVCKFPNSLAEQLNGVDYQAVLCLVLGLKKPLSDKYWLNIADNSLQIGGVIEHTNFIPKATYGGQNIVYLFSYVEQDNPLWLKSKDEERIIKIFESDLKKIFPQFVFDDITFSLLFKSLHATPVYEVGFAEKMPNYTTSIDGLYLAGTAHVYPLDRNMDGAVKVGKAVASLISA